MVRITTLLYSLITIFYRNSYVKVLHKSNYLMGKNENSMVGDGFSIMLVHFTNRFFFVFRCLS